MPVNPEPDLPHFKKGDPLSARLFNRLIEAIRKQRVTAVAPLETKVGPAGTVIRWNGPRMVRYAKTTSTLSAISGSTLGSGTVQLYFRNPGLGTLSAMSDHTGEKCYNLTGSSVSSGTWCIVEWVDDAWAIVVADCASGG